MVAGCEGGARPEEQPVVAAFLVLAQCRQALEQLHVANTDIDLAGNCHQDGVLLGAGVGEEVVVAVGELVAGSIDGAEVGIAFQPQP